MLFVDSVKQNVTLYLKIYATDNYSILWMVCWMDGARFRPLLFVAMFPSVQRTRANDLGRVYDVQVGGRDEIKNRPRTNGRVICRY